MTWEEATESAPEEALEIAVAVAPMLDEPLGEALVEWAQRRCLEVRAARPMPLDEGIPAGRYAQTLQHLECLFGQGFHLVSKKEQREASRGGDSYTDDADDADGADGAVAQEPHDRGADVRSDTPESPPEEEGTVSVNGSTIQRSLQFSSEEVTGALEQFTSGVADFAKALNARQTDLARLELQIAELSSRRLLLMLEGLLQVVETWNEAGL